jgi:hypothetical protein
MINPHENENFAAWQRWLQVTRTIASLMQKREFAAALSAVDQFLIEESDPELRSDALGFRADLRAQTGDLRAANEDLLAARSLTGATYLRYVHELSLGTLCRKQQQIDEAISWYRAALQTCIEGSGISAGNALSEFLRLQPQDVLTPPDRAVFFQAAEKSWRVLGVPGNPEETNLHAVVATIQDAEARRKQQS